MPSISTKRETVTVELPETGAKVQMYKEFLTGDYRRSMTDKNIDAAGVQITYDNSFDFVLALIHEWDLTDEDGKKLKISKDSLDLLPIADFNKLAEHVGKASNLSSVNRELKKNT